MSKITILPFFIWILAFTAGFLHAIHGLKAFVISLPLAVIVGYLIAIFKEQS